MYEALELGGFESAAVVADFSSPEASVDVSVGIAGRDGVLPRLVMPATRKLTAASLLPDDYVLAVGGALTSASDWVDGLCGLIERLDPDIGDEYQRERAKVAREFGFDPQSDFLGNIVDDWAFGLTANADNRPAGALLFKLADADLFVAHLRNLVTAYRLPIETRVYADTEILIRADGGRPNVALAVHDGYLMVSNSAEILAGIIDARQQGRTIRASAKGPTTRKLVTSPAAVLASFNVARLAQLALAEDDFGDDEAGLVPTMERVAASQARITLAAKANPRALSFKVVFNGSMTVAARDFLTKSLAASWAAANEQSRRAVSMGNVRGIVAACQVYADRHKGEWPRSLGVLAAEGSIAPLQCRSPYDGSGPLSAEDVDRESFYIYRPGLSEQELRRAPELIVVAEPEIRRGQGAAFGFIDGHVEWITEPEAGRLLAQLRPHTR
ncbi:MAG: hypothetical protein GY778_00995 [bacterium]|nr:hypothetical protein [bacterium]